MTSLSNSQQQHLMCVHLLILIFSITSASNDPSAVTIATVLMTSAMFLQEAYIFLYLLCLTKPMFVVHTKPS